ncbi:MAG TPA: cytidylate kinase family protein, partial [Gemmataceae bacterium]|nr:cytidylate kinase family protein [Gemmataceae bacterium]
MQPPYMDHEDPTTAAEMPAEAPRHGYQGERETSPAAPRLPAGLCIAVSREAGARGGAIGRRVGHKLGWQVYDQEVLEYMAQDGVVRQGVL